MGFTDYGLTNLGSFVMGLSPSPIDYMAFGTDSSPNDFTKNYLGGEVIRKGVTWTWEDNIPKANVELVQSDAVGSNLRELGFCIGSDLGSNLYSRDLSAIGIKENSFSVTIEAEVRFTRK